MNPKVHARYKAQAMILKALAHPTRLFIVDELARQERCVCELAEMVGADQSTVSRHLALLRNSGIVRDEKRGSQVFYSLQIACVLDFFTCIQSVRESLSKELLDLNG